MPDYQYVLDDDYMKALLRTSNFGATWAYGIKLGVHIMWMGTDPDNRISLSARSARLLSLEEIIEFLYAADPQYRPLIPILLELI